MAGELERALLADLKRDFEAGIDAMVDVMKAAAPRKTGTLRSSIRPVISQFEAVIATNTGEEYPGILEAGTGGIRIRPTTKKALFWTGAPHPFAAVNGTDIHKGWWSDAMVKAEGAFDKEVGC